MGIWRRNSIGSHCFDDDFHDTAKKKISDYFQQEKGRIFLFIQRKKAICFRRFSEKEYRYSTVLQTLAPSFYYRFGDPHFNWSRCRLANIYTRRMGNRIDTVSDSSGFKYVFRILFFDP